jgi:hypothetical protein
MEGMDDLLASLYRHFNDDTVLDLARKLIAVPSHTPAGEKEAAAMLARFMEQASLTPQCQRVEDVRVNLLATLPGPSFISAVLISGAGAIPGCSKVSPNQPSATQILRSSFPAIRRDERHS